MDKIQYKLLLFNISIALIYVAYIFTFFGIAIINQTYIRKFSIIFQLVICIFLIYRFYPSKEIAVITKLDKSIIFYCATFLLMNVVATEVYITFLQGTIIGNEVNNVKNKIDTTIDTTIDNTIKN